MTEPDTTYQVPRHVVEKLLYEGEVVVETENDYARLPSTIRLKLQ